MNKKFNLTLLIAFISFSGIAKNTFDSLIVSKTKNLLPNEIAIYTFNYCNKNLETNTIEVFEVLNGLNSYLKEHPNIKQWPSYYYHLANYYRLIDEPDSALVNYNKCLYVPDNLPVEFQLKALLAKSNINTNKNELTVSFNILNEIKESIQHEDKPELWGHFFLQHAINNVKEQNYSIASTQFQKALNNYNKANNTQGVAQVNSELAHMYSQLGNYPMALDYFEKAENTFRNSKHKWFLAKNQFEIGEIHYYASQFPDALRYLISAEAIFKQLANKKKLIQVYQIKGQTYTALRNFNQAEFYLNKALLLSLNYESLKPEVLYNIGELNYEQELYNKAQPFFTESLESTLSPSLKLKLYEKLSDINSKLNNYNKAYKYQVLYNGLQRKILISENQIKEERLKRELERQYVNNESEKTLLQNELAILLEGRNNQKSIYQLAIVLLFVIVLISTSILFKKQKSNIKLHKALKETIKLQQEQISKSTIEYDRLNKSSERILNLSTKNIWEPFWVLENITNEIVDQELLLSNKNNNKAFDDDQLIMARNLLENILYWSMNQQKQIELQQNYYTVEQILKPIVQTQTIRAKAKKIDLDYKQTEKGKLYIDRQTIQVALRNIIENAIKFSTLNGSISIIIETSNSYIDIIVHDDGVGMTKEQIKTLFSKSNQHQASGTHGEKGIGLGLNLAKDFIEINFGKLKIESSVAYGTTVTITLPCNSPLKS